jgi:hypothetical protein
MSSARPKSSIAAGCKDARGGKSKFPKAEMRPPPVIGQGPASPSLYQQAVSGADADIDFDPRAGSPARSRLAVEAGGQAEGDDDDFNPRVSAGSGSAAKASTSSVETDMDSMFSDLPPRSSTITLPGRPATAGTTVALPLAGTLLLVFQCF